MEIRQTDFDYVTVAGWVPSARHAWVAHSLEVMGAAAAEQQMPVQPHRLAPALSDSFWVCLIGRGYAARARSSAGVLNGSRSGRRIGSSGEAILVLGTRKAESAARGRR